MLEKVSPARSTASAVTEGIFETSMPLAVVRILGGPRDGERFAMRLDPLAEEAVFRYFGSRYAFVREPRSGHWGATPLPPNPETPETDTR